MEGENSDSFTGFHEMGLDDRILKVRWNHYITSRGSIIVHRGHGTGLEWGAIKRQ